MRNKLTQNVYRFPAAPNFSRRSPFQNLNRHDSCCEMLNSRLKIASGSKLVMIGDSVTDCNRAKPVGEGLFGALGEGYVRDISSLLQVCEPNHRIRIVNMGIGGNTVRDLEARWDNDVMKLKPDWLSIMIGINDVWRQFDSPSQPEQGVPLEEYEATLQRLVTTTLPSIHGLVLMSPFFIELNKADAMRARMDEYGEVVKTVAANTGAVFVDAQAAFDRMLHYGHSSAIAWDRVHPNPAGHMALAKAFLDAIGFQWNPPQTTAI
jgi:lysophospholipase L1-like esterase